ncbi:MAG: transcription elongation factor GreA, partial [Treponema sp.]|nr:transcription elongation factor GreA [Treponema sp.]
KKIKAELSPAILTAGEWSTWSTKARDILRTNPEFGISPEKNDVFVVKDRPAGVTEKLFNEFSAGRNFYERVSSIREYVNNKNTDSGSELFMEMFSYFTSFLRSGDQNAEYSIASYLLINELSANKKYSHLKTSLNMSFTGIFSGIKDVNSVFKNIKDTKIKTEFLNNIRLSINEWPDIYLKLFSFSQLPFITERLEEANLPEKLTVMCNDCFENAVIVSQHRDNREAVVWFYKNSRNKEWFKAANINIEKQLITLIRILDITYRDIENHKDTVENRKINKLVYNILFKDKDLFSFIDNSDEEAIIRVFTFINDLKDLDPQDKLNLRSRILDKYPGFKFFGEAEKKVSRALWVTHAMFEKKKKQLAHIMDVEVPANSKEIEYALSLGDLRENAEYKAAKEKQEQLNSQLAKLKEDIERAQLFDPNSINTSRVSFGTKVILRNESADKQEEYTILGPWESDPNNNIISYLSPFGSAILNREAGEKFEFAINEERNSYLVEQILKAEI